MTERDEPRGVSVQISAVDLADARDLFNRCVELASTGRKYNGDLVFIEGKSPSGCAALYTHLP